MVGLLYALSLFIIRPGNNGLYPIISNLFIMAPVSFVFLIRECFKNVREEYVFVCKSMVILSSWCTFVQLSVWCIFLSMMHCQRAKQLCKDRDSEVIHKEYVYHCEVKRKKLEALGGYLTQNHLTVGERYCLLRDSSNLYF